MKFNLRTMVISCSAVLLAASFSLQAGEVHKHMNDSTNNKSIVLKFYNDFFNKHDVDSASVVVADNYIQHNPDVPDGKKPFVSYFRGFFKDNPHSRAKIVRSASDGDLVWLHVHSTNGDKDRGQSVVDIFRLKDGKIVEHWDVIQNVPEEAANKNTMF